VTSEKVRLRIGNLAKAVLVTGQAYQDPKDALNEFVSNAADEYVEADRAGGRIRMALRRKGRHPVVAVEDDGRGMSSERLRQLARNLFESTKAGDDRTLGEKAIGILAFQQLGTRCDIVTREEGSEMTHVLRLERGKATAQLEIERRRARQAPGTTVYLAGLETDVLRVLTQRKVVDYLRRRRGPALAAGHYSIEVVEGRSAELVTPEQPDVRLDLPAHKTLWGRIEFALYVAAPDDKRRRVAVVGRAGTTIIDDLTELEECDRPPWTTDQVGGQIVFAALAQTAGRRAILRDGEAFPVFLDAVRAVEPLVSRTLERVAREVDEQTADRLADAVRRIFDRVLKELADLDNPMRSAVGTENGDGALLDKDRSSGSGNADSLVRSPAGRSRRSRTTSSGRRRSPTRSFRQSRKGSAPGGCPRSPPDPDPGEARSRFDPDARVVYYNDHHVDYLLVRDEEPVLLDYLATLVAKEYVVYNNPRATTADLGEEIVRILVRVRRHLPRRR